jgi:hypothetical protein
MCGLLARCRVLPFRYSRHHHRHPHRSGPVLRIGTLASRLSPLGLLPWHRSDWFLQFHAIARIRFTPSLRRSPSAQSSGTRRTHPRRDTRTSFRRRLLLNDASSRVHFRSSLGCAPAQVCARAFLPTLRSPGSRARSVRACQGLRPRRAVSGACLSAPDHVAFRRCDSVGARNIGTFAVQWLACTLPYRRFADILAGACARLGADVVRYTFLAGEGWVRGARRVLRAAARVRTSARNDPSIRTRDADRCRCDLPNPISFRTSSLFS